MAPAELLIGSRWHAPAVEERTRDALSPFDGSTVGTVGAAGPEDAERGAAVRWRTPARERDGEPAEASDVLTPTAPPGVEIRQLLNE